MTRHGAARHGAVAVVLSTVAAVAVVACGGKIDDSSRTQVSPRPTTDPGPPPLPTVGPLPGPDPSPVTAANDIADAYCTTFGNCCQSSGQPPIDIARCREVVATAVSSRISRGGPAGPSQVKTCVAAITARTAACGKEDVEWFAFNAVALFAPTSIQTACSPLIGFAAVVGGAPCNAKKPCSNGEVCAIDECTLDPGRGGSCPNDVCLDGLACNSSKVCAQASLGATGARCITSENCQLGLVCEKNECVTARSVPSLYQERHSPYRVGFDTCRIFQFL